MSNEVKITQQKGFSNLADYDAFSVIRLHNKVVSSLGGRHSWVRIDSAAGRTAYRMIRGAGSKAPFPTDAMELDYETGISLGIPPAPRQKSAEGFYPCNLMLRRATRWEILRAHWGHPDPAYRFPLQISLVSFFLGVVALVLGALSLK